MENLLRIIKAMISYNLCMLITKGRMMIKQFYRISPSALKMANQHFRSFQKQISSNDLVRPPSIVSSRASNTDIERKLNVLKSSKFKHIHQRVKNLSGLQYLPYSCKFCILISLVSKKGNSEKSDNNNSRKQKLNLSRSFIKISKNL